MEDKNNNYYMILHEAIVNDDVLQELYKKKADILSISTTKVVVSNIELSKTNIIKSVITGKIINDCNPLLKEIDELIEHRIFQIKSNFKEKCIK